MVSDCVGYFPQLKPELMNVTGGFDVALEIPVAASFRNGLPAETCTDPNNTGQSFNYNYIYIYKWIMLTGSALRKL